MGEETGRFTFSNKVNVYARFRLWTVNLSIGVCFYQLKTGNFSET